MLKHNVWYHIFYSLNHNPYCYRNCGPQLWAAPLRYRHGVIFTPTPTPSWTSTTSSFARCCQLSNYSCCRDPVSQFVASPVKSPCIKKYIRGQDPAMLCACAFIELYCWVAFGHQSPGGVVVKALLLALHDKDNSFFCQKRNRILNAAVLEVLLPWMLLLWLMLLWSTVWMLLRFLLLKVFWWMMILWVLLLYRYIKNCFRFKLVFF